MLDKFKQALKVFNDALTDEKLMTEAVLADGTAIMWEGELAEGVAIKTADENGEPVSLPDGEYTLEDGTVFVIAGGLVQTLNKDVAADNEFDAKKFEQDILAAVDVHIDKKLGEFMKELEGYFMSKKSVETDLSKKFNEVKQSVNSMADAVLEALKDAKPARSPRQEMKKMTAADRAYAMAKAIKENK